MSTSRVQAILRGAVRSLRGAPKFDDRQYWEERYAAGGTSGDGSYGQLAEFKARVLNQFIVDRQIASAIELGCGDGNQLSLIHYPRYVGLDVSASAIRRCIDRFRGDRCKSFFIYDPEAYDDSSGIFRADAALSLDVIYHIVTDDLFELYMTHLCAAARRFVVVYATNEDRREATHVRHRAFSRWIDDRGEFELVEQVPNPYPGTGTQQSDASFFIFGRTSERAR